MQTNFLHLLNEQAGRLTSKRHKNNRGVWNFFSRYAMEEKCGLSTEEECYDCFQSPRRNVCFLVNQSLKYSSPAIILHLFKIHSAKQLC